VTKGLGASCDSKEKCKTVAKDIASKRLEREAGGQRQQNAECQPDEHDVTLPTVQHLIRLIAARTVA
jgi:hypothetical protein